MFSVKSHNSKATTDNSEGRASFRVTTLIATVLRDRGVHFVLVVHRLSWGIAWLTFIKPATC